MPIAAVHYVALVEIRKLELDDFAAAYALSGEAFGPPPAGSAPPTPPTELPAGRHDYGAFDDGRLVARVAALELASWFGGAEVPTTGIASVAIAAEHRGAGLLLPLFELALSEAEARGEVISTLYPTANGIYRGLGYEVITSYDQVEIPTAELLRIPLPADIRLRRAVPADVPAMAEVYADWASAQHGPLTRTGPRFAASAEELLGGYTGVTLALDEDDDVVGWAGWERSEGYGPHGVLELWDLYATSPDAYRALWASAASFASVAGTVRLRTSGADPARLVLPTSAWASVARHQHAYALRLNDVAGAFSALAPYVPGLVDTEVDFAVAGDRLGVTDGHYRLGLGKEPGWCEEVPPEGDVPTFTTQGIALAFAGAQSCENLRFLGHLTGPDDHDELLDAVLGGRQLHVRDYF